MYQIIIFSLLNNINFEHQKNCTPTLKKLRTMSSNSESQEPLQERLKDQVSVSIKEALDKANTVLTNLHRVQSYLDVIRILSTHRSSDVIKNALEQIHAARNDTATLLQHIYLTEIGLQSLQVHVAYVISIPQPPRKFR